MCTCAFVCVYIHASMYVYVTRTNAHPHTHITQIHHSFVSGHGDQVQVSLSQIDQASATPVSSECTHTHTHITHISSGTTQIHHSFASGLVIKFKYLLAKNDKASATPVSSPTRFVSSSKLLNSLYNSDSALFSLRRSICMYVIHDSNSSQLRLRTILFTLLDLYVCNSESIYKLKFITTQTLHSCLCAVPPVCMYLRIHI
jgi:hypothetical protein